jgi:NAD(P)-dependent dehydrogenase (short-subunit alcohol dehydrogenase family)
MWLSVDVTDETAVKAAFERVDETFGRLDAMFHCAGVQLTDRDAPVDELESATWRATIDVNLTGTFLCCKYAVRSMLRSGGGSIITCGSPTGLTGRGWRYHAYSASKGGVHALSKAMAVAYGPRGIRVNCLVPGTIRTDMTRLALADGSRAAELEARTALRRIGTPEDLTGAAVYLASDESAYASGGMFVVDGGLMVT